MLTIEEVREKLKDRKINVIAKAVGLHYNTVSAIKNASSPNPSYEAVKLLSDYFEAQK